MNERFIERLLNGSNSETQKEEMDLIIRRKDPCPSLYLGKRKKGRDNTRIYPGNLV